MLRNVHISGKFGIVASSNKKKCFLTGCPAAGGGEAQADKQPGPGCPSRQGNKARIFMGPTMSSEGVGPHADKSAGTGG